MQPLPPRKPHLGYPITQVHGMAPGAGCEPESLPNQTLKTSRDMDHEDPHPPAFPVIPSNSLQSFEENLVD